jgi:uncharacterized damage-inducible protein DinB
VTGDIHTRADRLLLTFLDAQRRSVLEIVEGLSDDDLQKPVVPSGWTPLGLIEHLGGAEYFWFQIVAAGAGARPSELEEADESAADAADAYSPFTTEESKQSVFDFYREQCERANALLETTALSTPPRGQVLPGMEAEVFDLRGIVLHMIEETARHAGHLDIARELLDGTTGLGPR